MVYDVVTMGETMIRFTPPHLQRIEQAQNFDLYCGGSESNVSVGLARLGLNVAWLSRLTDNPMGHAITNVIRQFGVDTSHVIWTPNDRVGLYFVEEGTPPRGISVYYDRANSAMSRIQPDDIDDNYFINNPARLFHSSGITLAIGEPARETTYKMFKLAKEANCIISFDFNYRHKLWSVEDAVKYCDPCAELADIIFIPVRDAIHLYGLSSDSQPHNIMKYLQSKFPETIIVMTLGADGAMGCNKQGDIQQEMALPITPLSRVGAGDAFVAGFLYAYLTNGFDNALRWGVCASALKFSIQGDMPLFTHAELSNLVAGDGDLLIKR